MGFGRLLTRGRAEVMERAAGAAFQVIIDGQPVNYPLSLYGGGMSLPGAWRAALKISDAIGSLKWDLWRELDGQVPERVSPRPMLLEKPDPREESMTTFSSWALDLIWHGNGIGLYVGRDRDGVPEAVLPIPASQVGVRRIGRESISALPIGTIEYSIGGQTFAPWEIFHIKGPCQPSDVRGFGVLEAHLSGLTGDRGGTLDLAAELQRQAKAVSSHGVPTGLLKSENPDLTKPEAQDLKQTWAEGQRTRTIQVLNATTSFEPLSWNPTEMQLVEARKMSLLETALVFGVQPSDLGVETSSRTYRNDNAEDVKFVKWGLRGHVARFEAALSSAWPTPELKAKADLEPFTQQDPATRATTNKARAESGTWKTNELRATDGLAPIPGGDELMKPPATTPAKEVNPDADTEDVTEEGDQPEADPA